MSWLASQILVTSAQSVFFVSEIRCLQRVATNSAVVVSESGLCELEIHYCFCAW